MSFPAAIAGVVPGQSRERWLMLGLVWSLYACFGITTGTMPPLVEPIINDLGLSYSQMGLVLGAWQLVYIGTAYPMGVLVDRIGVRRSLGIGILLVLLSLVLRGMATGFVTLFLAVALFGVGGPIISIGAPKVVAQWFRGNQRGLATGIYATGPVGGAALALATAGSVVVPLTGTWRGISLVYGGVVLLVAIAWWLFSRDAPVEAAERLRQEGNAEPAPVEDPSSGSRGSLLRIRNVQLLLVMAAGAFLLNHGLNNWTPTLLKEGGMSLARAGTLTAAATATGAMGLLFIPSQAKRGRRVLALAALLVVASATSVGLALAQGPALLASLLLSAIVRSPLMPILTLVLMETPGVGAARMGVAGGLFFSAAEIGGFSGPFLLGFLRDATGSLTAGVIALAAVAAALLLALPFLKEQR
ncbi:MAG: MFS transporter [Chloroflexi bacterium]|nr:MFS transporter [Chloroflexota bacterium]